VHGGGTRSGAYRLVEEVRARILPEITAVDKRRLRQGLERIYARHGVEPPNAQRKLSAVGTNVDNRIKVQVLEYAVVLGAGSDPRSQRGRAILRDGEYPKNLCQYVHSK
jgi:hypothetical protein